jgi:hypothetical protein
MAQDLFRLEAVEFSTQRLHGHVVVRPRLSHVGMVVVLLTSICLFGLTLAFGTHIERRRVSGEIVLVREGSGGTRDISVLLYAPKTLSNVISVGQRMQLELVGFDRQVGHVDASVIEISTQSKVREPSEGAGGKVYVPVTLDVDESALVAAGLPTDGDYKLDVAVELVVSRQSWVRWLMGCLVDRAHSP